MCARTELPLAITLTDTASPNRMRGYFLALFNNVPAKCFIMQRRIESGMVLTH
jgi:hypothetical protein